jgi:hypothetical protein
MSLTMTEWDAAEVAAKGAQLLDVRAPGWPERVDPLELEMSSTCGCVVGQTFGVREGSDYDAAIAELGLDVYSDGDNGDAAYGFMVPDKVQDRRHDAWGALTDAWIAEIEARR